jgi:hypothetical protein
MTLEMIEAVVQFSDNNEAEASSPAEEQVEKDGFSARYKRYFELFNEKIVFIHRGNMIPLYEIALTLQVSTIRTSLFPYLTISLSLSFYVVELWCHWSGYRR